MDLGSQGMRAVVTAASRGPGKAAAIALAQEGAQLAICSNSEMINQSADEIRQAGGGLVYA